MPTNPTPKAKTERLIVREIDGETSVAEIPAALCKDERAVWLALHQLTKAQLLTEAIAFPPDMSAAKSRREVGARLGLGAAAFVTSIVAPLPAQAASCLAQNSPCPPVLFGPGPCCSPFLCLPHIASPHPPFFICRL
jgi:hypothetical protein